MTTIAILNESTVVKDADVLAATNALRKQVNDDFCPAWDLAAPAITFVAKGQAIPAGAWQLVILDNSDQAGALGYHDLTAEGLPLGKVFAKDDIDNKTSWTNTASHELLEMLADPWLNFTALVQTAAKSGRVYALEVADPVEDDSFGYQIDGILVSDFVTPAWFTPGLPGPYDHQKKLNAQFELLPGGYISLLKFSSKKGWTQITAKEKEGGKKAPVGSRRERRARGCENWKRSTAEWKAAPPPPAA